MRRPPDPATCPPAGEASSPWPPALRTSPWRALEHPLCSSEQVAPADIFADVSPQLSDQVKRTLLSDMAEVGGLVQFVLKRLAEDPDWMRLRSPEIEYPEGRRFVARVASGRRWAVNYRLVAEVIYLDKLRVLE